MKRAAESLEAFYSHKLVNPAAALPLPLLRFSAFSIEANLLAGLQSPSFIRRDFFKIMLFQGENVFHYSDKSIAVSGNTLLFFSPKVPYTYDPLKQETKGFFCVFREAFFQENLRLNMADLPLFSPGAPPVFPLSNDQFTEVRDTFKKILREQASEYEYRYELIKNYVSELIYLALKLQPSENAFDRPDAASRITNLFTELLDRQFPITSSSQRFEFRSPKSFADRLSVHVNYLNRAIKKTTGRTTSELIFGRMAGEAKALLKHSNWNISEIGYSLGFESQANFNNFFKKQTGKSPTAFRRVRI